ncbi:Uncharacterised protein [Mycobacteroides abscessus subsp. abscessus]|nr:Uncharacterised protein [Mycobacteroides abscessus subsp. abscessus]
MALGPDLPQSQFRVERFQQLRDVAVGHRNALGSTGSTRRVDDVRDVIHRRNRQCGVILRADRRIVDIDHRHTGGAEAREQFRRGDRDDWGGVTQHEVDARIGMGRIDRQIRRSGLEHSQDGGDRFAGTRQQQCHTLTGTSTVGHQVVRQTVRGGVQFTVAPRPFTTGDRDRLRGACHLRGEKFRNRCQRRLRPDQHRPVTPLVQPVVFAGIE